MIKSPYAHRKICKGIGEVVEGHESNGLFHQIPWVITKSSFSRWNERNNKNTNRYNKNTNRYELHLNNKLMKYSSCCLIIILISKDRRINNIFTSVLFYISYGRPPLLPGAAWQCSGPGPSAPVPHLESWPHWITLLVGVYTTYIQGIGWREDYTWYIFWPVGANLG